MPKTARTYPFLQKIISTWKDRAKAAGLKQKELAVLSDISEAHLSQIINGHVADPRMHTIDAIETVLQGRGV